MQTKDFLLEIGCEELPIAAVKSLSNALKNNIEEALNKADLSHGNIQTFATPRRLALLAHDLALQQTPRKIERIGPNIEAAYAKDGSFSIAFLGFARSCGVSTDEVQTKKTPRGKKLYCLVEKEGALTKDLLPELIKNAIKKLPIPKPMRWGNHDIAFVRPVHWILMLLGTDVVQAKILGKAASGKTYGHRFHHPMALVVQKPSEYSAILSSQGHVIPDFEARKNLIKKLAQHASEDYGNVVLDEALLDEVTSLVEWPVAHLGQFSIRFLKTPKEALISSMKKHQKCFPIINDKGELQPCFIMISNIESKHKESVINGNEKVINARLSDATFFFEQDLKQTLDDRLEKLKQVTFQEKLGSLHDRSKRLEKLAAHIAKKLKCKADIVKNCKRAALLCKCDLVSKLVYEFPELQGIAGYYYARGNKESKESMIAIREHYKPAFSGDDLPETIEGQIISLADKLDLLVGIIGINQLPTGDKDPFALRRAALGIVRILTEKNISIGLISILKQTEKNYSSLPNKKAAEQTFDFILQRLKAFYLDQDMPVQIFMAVEAVKPTDLLDFVHRMLAVVEFTKLPEAADLSAANKRVFNILKKQKGKIKEKVETKLFESNTEKQLWNLIQKHQKSISKLCKEHQYTESLRELAELKTPIDVFFDEVLVMAKNKKVRDNRLALLAKLRELFIQVADVALLS